MRHNRRTLWRYKLPWKQWERCNWFHLQSYQKLPMVFLVVRYRCELDHKEDWALNNWCFWTAVVLEKTLENPLNCKEIQLVNPKGNRLWIFTGRTDAEVEAPKLWPPDTKRQFTGEDPDAGKGFPNSSVGKESTCNAGDPWFDSWVGKIRWRRDRLPTPVFLGFPCGSASKESAHNARDPSSVPGLGRSPGEGKGYPLQCSDLENSMDCKVHGVTKSQAWLSDSPHFTSFHFQSYPELVSELRLCLSLKRHL